MQQTDSNTKIKWLLNDIGAYIDFLTTRRGLKISIHQLDTLVNSFMCNLFPWNYHLSPYCQCLKRSKEARDECVRRQQTLFKHIGEKPFFGTCWAGMGEYVFPIPNLYGAGRGFISVSGYKGEPTKAKVQMQKISQKYGIALIDLQHAYDELAIDYPPIEELAVLIQPLVHMITLLLNFLHDTAVQLPAFNSSSGHLFASICHMLQCDYSEHYSVETLAKMYNCSASHISHIFSKYGGCSYGAYVNNMRMNIAKLLLTTTPMNMQEIADHLGFSNANYFSTVFHRTVGMSPRDYRCLNNLDKK